jgi:hypothetical protein
MITNIASTGVPPADIAALRQNRAKKTEPAQDTTVETGKTQKPAHPAHPKGHIPPGLERAAENIAAKIFARADVDGSGSVTKEELSAIHSRHARTLAASDLFQSAADAATSAPVETPADSEAITDTGIDTVTETDSTATDTTDAVADSTTDTAIGAATDTTEPTTQASTQIGLTEAQLKEALVKSFYAKVGVTWTRPTPSAPPAPPEVEEPAPTTPDNTTTTPVVDSISDDSDSTGTFTAVA